MLVPATIDAATDTLTAAVQPSAILALLVEDVLIIQDEDVAPEEIINQAEAEVATPEADMDLQNNYSYSIYLPVVQQE